MQGDARADHRRSILRALAKDLEPGNREFFVLRIKDRSLRARGPQIVDSAAPGHRFGQTLGGNGITRIEHRRTVNRAKHRQVLESHLRRPILADRNAAVRSAEIDIAAADRRHAHLVVRARRKAGESIEEGNFAEGRQANADAHQILLGNVALDRNDRDRRRRKSRRTWSSSRRRKSPRCAGSPRPGA